MDVRQRAEDPQRRHIRPPAVEGLVRRDVQRGHRGNVAQNVGVGQRRAPEAHRNFCPLHHRSNLVHQRLVEPLCHAVGLGAVGSGCLGHDALVAVELGQGTLHELAPSVASNVADVAACMLQLPARDDLDEAVGRLALGRHPHHLRVAGCLVHDAQKIGRATSGLDLHWSA